MGVGERRLVAWWLVFGRLPRFRLERLLADGAMLDFAQPFGSNSHARPNTRTPSSNAAAVYSWAARNLSGPSRMMNS